jgi:imidazolonepropionase-like amidohydrolase
MPAPFAVRDVTVVACDPEGSLLPGRTVTVDERGRISAVGPVADVAIGAGVRTVDGAGRFLMPGLINAHAHLFADGRRLPPIVVSRSAERLVALFGHSPFGRALVARRAKANVLTQLRSGVTTLRSLGDVGYEVVAVGAAIERGDYVGPRVLASGPLLAVPGGHGAPQIALTSDSPSQARRNVQRNLRHGVTAIKIAATGGVTDARSVGEAGRPQMTVAQMTAICEEAHAAGLLVAAHAQSREGVLRALRAGVDTIEHGASMTDEIAELFRSNPRSLRGFSALVPTLQAGLPLVRLPPRVTGIGPVVRANAELAVEEALRGVRDAVEHGVLIGMGTDSALTFVTHYNTWREVDLVARLTPLGASGALHAATRANARILGLETETGAIEPGRAADLVLLDENPLRSLRTLTRPVLVSARGHVLDHPEVHRFDDVDRLLDTI